MKEEGESEGEGENQPNFSANIGLRKKMERGDLQALSVFLETKILSKCTVSTLENFY